MKTGTLQTSLEQIENGEMSADEFARLVFGSEEQMLSLVQGTHAGQISMTSAEVNSFVRVAAVVIREAIQVNPDETTVTRWFLHERLALFGNKTPAEITARGKSDALIAYIQSLDAGWTG